MRERPRATWPATALRYGHANGDANRYANGDANRYAIGDAWSRGDERFSFIAPVLVGPGSGSLAGNVCSS